MNRATMDDELLQDVGGSRPGPDGRSRGSKDRQTTGSVTTDSGSDGGGGWPWMKRLRLQRHPSFGSVDEDRSSTTNKSDTGTVLSFYRRVTGVEGCPHSWGMCALYVKKAIDSPDVDGRLKLFSRIC